jgi:prolyl-tRNA synthetase
MRQSQLFTKTRKEAPSDEVSKNAQLLIRAGYIHKEMAGVYSILPLGFKVLNNIKKIVNDEMEKLGSQEIIMSTLQKKENWEVTDRWSDEKVDVWFKSKLKNETEIGFGWSHEEPITFMVKDHIQSYKDLPVFVHQFQNKLRNEVRAKSGIMRCREFVMKDMYSYCIDEEKHMEFYNKTIEAYMNVYKRVGLGDITYVTSASGGVFTDKFSHEFQTLCEAGEDNIYVHKTKPLAINEEVYNEETLKKLDAKPEDFELKKAAEVGNIFTFGTGKCEQIGLNFTDVDGVKKPVYLGSYGIGVTRLLGVITEVMSDEGGIVWPATVAPFALHIVTLYKDTSDEAYTVSKDLYEKLTKSGVEVLWDDRESVGAGEKFADADLLGMPMRVTVSTKSLIAGGVEIKERVEKDKTKSEIVSIDQLITMYTKVC